MTDTRHVQITMDGTRGTLTLGGHDLTPALSGFTLRAGADMFPELELDVIALTADVQGDQNVQVVIPRETRDALVALGWIPPAPVGA